MEDYSKLRSIPLHVVFGWLGHSEWKTRKGKNGQERYGKCPYHEAKTNTTSFSFTDEVFHCFSCNAKGKGAIDAVKLYNRCNFTEAVQFLKDSGNAHTPQTPQGAGQDERHMNQQEQRGENKPFDGKYEKYYKPCEWLEKRIPQEVIRKLYGVGMYDNPSRESVYRGKIMIPIRRFSDGLKVGYLARNINPKVGEGKYLFPKNFVKHVELYGAYELKTGQVPLLPAGTSVQLPLRVVYVVESPFCVMKFASMGFPAVSPFGWSVSDEQLQILTQVTRGVVYLPDRNKYDSASGVLSKIAPYLWCRWPKLPEASNDPEQLSREQILAL